MTVFEGAVLNQTIAVAKKHNIEAPALLAVVEVESAGKSLESDGKTPCLLFERHIFYRELTKAKKITARNAAVSLGLANSVWKPDTQYKDQGTSAKRLALFARAKSIDAECAIRSCSWGVGQTMGFLAEEMKFPNAVTMFDYMLQGGVPAQVECMIREIENRKLGAKLNAHNWAGFAKIYNGPSYAKNKYDTKMAAAYTKWRNATLPTAAVVKPVVVSNEVRPQAMPAPASSTQKAGGVAAATVAGGAGVVAAAQEWDYQTIAFGVFILALIVITVVVLWKRHRDAQIPQLGVLATVDAVGAT